MCLLHMHTKQIKCRLETHFEALDVRSINLDHDSEFDGVDAARRSRSALSLVSLYVIYLSACHV